MEQEIKRNKGLKEQMEKHFIEVRDLVKIYRTGKNAVTAVDHVSFLVEKGEFVGIMGASGSGKTTLLNMLSAIDRASGGSILYDGADISRMTENELADFRRENLGFIFQDYNLLDTLNIEENIMLPRALDNRNREETQRRVMGIARTLNIVDIMQRFPYEVSGGQKQRAACARALVNDPKLILADEPTGALDSRSSAMLLGTLQVMNRELGATILMVTHDAYSASCCRRILFLRDGRICFACEKNGRKKKDYVNHIMDIQARIGGEDIYAE